MSPFFGSNDENAARWQLPIVAELLNEGEILCDLEGADCDGGGTGLLVVTDLRVLFVRRAVFGQGVHVVSVRLEDVVKAETFGSDSFPGHRNLGALAISSRRSLGDWATRPHDAAADALGQFAELLEEGETLCDAEKGVSLGWRSGILVVTDRRVAFFMGGMLWRRRCVVAAPYAEIAGVDVLDSPHTKWAVVVVATLTELWSDWRLKFDLSARRPRAEEVASMIQLQKKLESTAAHDPPDSWSDRIEFESIKGGRPRAEEITRAIVRQKLLLERGADSASGELDRANETANEDSDVQEVIGALPRVSVGRGVSVWVEVRGGRLYVWGEPLGSAFDRMEASVRRPEGVEFVACDAVTEFELHVEAGMRWTRPIYLGRRWFGLRDGIEVSTGLGMGQGGV